MKTFADDPEYENEKAVRGRILMRGVCEKWRPKQTIAQNRCSAKEAGK